MKKQTVKLKVSCESNQAHLVNKNGIKVYPVTLSGKWRIQVDNNGKITTYDKVVPNAEINDAIASTIIFFYNKLIEKQNAK